MSVTIVKPKAKVIDKVVASLIVSPETVDEYAHLKAKLAKRQEKLAPLTKEVAALEKGILGAVDDAVDASISFDLQGYENELKIGAKGEKTALTDIELARDILGEETFMKLVSISITDLKKYMTPDQVESVSSKSYAIKRRIKVEAI